MMKKYYKSILIIFTSALILVSTKTSFAQDVSNSTITTGDSNSQTVIQNNVNTNNINLCNGNCQTPTPTPTQTPTTPTPTTIAQTPTPTPTPSQGGGGSSNGGGGSSSGGSSGAGQSGPTQAVLGLSTTSGEENYLLQIAQITGALISGSLGFIFLKKNG